MFHVKHFDYSIETEIMVYYEHLANKQLSNCVKKLFSTFSLPREEQNPHALFCKSRNCADGTNPHAGTLEPPVLSEVLSNLWNKHLMSEANLVIVHAKQYRCERQVARACLHVISFQSAQNRNLTLTYCFIKLPKCQK
jgi:hypothetical protein